MRSEGNFIKINKRLLILSWLYGLAVRVRNLLFDWGVLKSRSFDIPVISVGNISVGGTGKTPQIEYLVQLLQPHFGIAVLSRGYKRQSKGYILAEQDMTPAMIGDEPYMIKQKYPEVMVAVDEKRVHGIKRIMHDAETSQAEVVLLDDAYQHRYVKPGVNILLVDYHRLIVYDRLLPAGSLREPVEGKQRADIVIVTKCPKDLKPMEYRVIRKAMDLYPYQKLFFATLQYGKPYQIFGNETIQLNKLEKNTHVLLVTGIASSMKIIKDLKRHAKTVEHMEYPDHHAFTADDIVSINQRFAQMPSPKLILTTEKDKVRIQHAEGLSPEVMKNIYVWPIKVKFMLDQESSFNQIIIDYVQQNQRNGSLAQRQDDRKS